jgi:hypothetical protein
MAALLGDMFLYLVGFADMSVAQKPCKEIDPNMKSFVACNLRDSVEHTCEIRTLEGHPLAEQKLSFRYSLVIPFRKKEI